SARSRPQAARRARPAADPPASALDPRREAYWRRRPSAAVGGSGGDVLHRINRRPPRRAPPHGQPRAPAGVRPNSGWIRTSLMMDHREVFLVDHREVFLAGTHTCMATKVLHPGCPLGWHNLHPMSQ
ncbi:hypothetical protein EJB05_09489, partial [Eragrostis curvula]